MKTIASLLSISALAVFVVTFGNESGTLAGFQRAVPAEHNTCNHAVDLTEANGFSSAMASPYGSTSTSLNNAVYDKKMRDEVANQRAFFQGVSAEVLILDEQAYELRNAYATKNGKIYFGKNMFFYTISHYNELAVAGILAHEWGHRVQYTYHWDKQLTTPELELEADALSGFYMALEKSFAWSQIHGYFASTLNTGDYETKSPQHHGTPNQRVAAAYLGVQLAIEAVDNGKAFTYEELHERIVAGIRADIMMEEGGAPVTETATSEIANGKLSGKEIVAPVLSAEERKKFYPQAN